MDARGLMPTVDWKGGLVRAAGWVAVLLAGPAAAHPWGLAEGHGQVILTQSWYRTAQVFSQQRDSQRLSDDGEFEKRSLRAFGEYGWNSRLTVLGKLELVDQDYGNRFSSDDNSGLADPELGLRYALPSMSGTEWRQALLATAKLPLGRQSGAPAIDNHQTDLELRYSVGSGVGAEGRLGYWFVDLGPRLRLGDPADELRADAGLGLNLHPRIVVLAESFLTLGLRNEDRHLGAVTQSPDYDLWVQQLSLVGWIGPHTRLQVGGFAHVWGRNTGAGYGALASLWQWF